MTTIPKPADRNEWLEARRGFFNASATAILWDRHPFQSPGDYATIKLTGNEQAPTRAMERGTRFEEVVARWWADDHHCKLVEPDVLYVKGRVMATVDRMVESLDPVFGEVAAGTPVEIKTTARPMRDVPQYWVDQCQAIMYATAAPEMVLVWLDSTMEVRWQAVLADFEFGVELARRADEFMSSIDLGVAPDWIEFSYDNLVALHPHPKGRLELDEEGAELVARLDIVRAIRRDAEADEEAVREQLARLLQGNEAGSWQGHDVITWKAARPTKAIDVKRLAEENPELAARYLVERPGSRRMLTHLEDVIR